MGDLGSITGLGRFPGEGSGYLLQYSGLENSMDRGAWQAIYSSQGQQELDLTEQVSLSLFTLKGHDQLVDFFLVGWW